MSASFLMHYIVLYAGPYRSQCIPHNDVKGFIFEKINNNTMAPEISPSVEPQPFLPLLAPSPATPISSSSLPKLSGIMYLPFFYDACHCSLISQLKTGLIMQRF